MNATPQKAKGPAEAATSPDHGSIIPAKETKMNTCHDITGSVPKPALSRRGFLGVMTAAAIPVSATAAEATPADRARFHAKALTDAMAEMHPEMSWRHAIDHKLQFVLVVGDERPASRATREDLA
jgi:hypothetical protein